ncbi:MAG: hypothetical protein ACI4LX_06695 [Treponema sp.]
MFKLSEILNRFFNVRLADTGDIREQNSYVQSEHVVKLSRLLHINRTAARLITKLATAEIMIPQLNFFADTWRKNQWRIYQSYQNQ